MIICLKIYNVYNSINLDYWLAFLLLYIIVIIARIVIIGSEGDGSDSQHRVDLQYSALQMMHLNPNACTTAGPVARIGMNWWLLAILPFYYCTLL